MTAEQAESNSLVITAWIFLLLASSLPRIVLQEVFGYQVSFSLASLIAGTVLLAGFVLTFFWNTVRVLRPFFILALCLVGIEWFVYTVIAHLPLYKNWLG